MVIPVTEFESSVSVATAPVPDPVVLTNVAVRVVDDEVTEEVKLDSNASGHIDKAPSNSRTSKVVGWDHTKLIDNMHMKVTKRRLATVMILSNTSLLGALEVDVDV